MHSRMALMHPRYWPSWIAVGIVWLIGRLPYRALIAIGRVLGAVTGQLRGERRQVAQRNLQLCFPELDDSCRAALLRATLRDLGLMFVEFALAWSGSERRLAAV